MKKQIVAGPYTNESGCSRDLTRRGRAGQTAIKAIRTALFEGEQSGEPQPFDSSQFKQEMAARYAVPLDF